MALLFNRHVIGQSVRALPKKSQRNSRRRLHFEPLEPRRFLDGQGWLSAAFDGGISGELSNAFQFTRNVATVDYLGTLVGNDSPRFATPRLAADTSDWTLVLDDILTPNKSSFLAGAGWDHDGSTPLAITIDNSNADLHFIRGQNFAIANTHSMATPNGNDLLVGAVPGYRYLPRNSIVHEGLVVFLTDRFRWDIDQWVSEGVSFVYTQDYGQTFQRVQQIGGGMDVPPIAGGVADGIPRGQKWSFSNAFPEQSPEDRLGAWFPWADYLHRESDFPKGGQIGLFRARRASLASSWVVEPNVLVYERWEPGDSGGLHSHSTGMFTDGLVSFWGDTDKRNFMARHVASDLENYTTATWTHDPNFHGGWSPAANPVQRTGNQGASTAPGAQFGQVLIAGDLQPELVMRVEAPAIATDPPIIANVLGTPLPIDNGITYGGRTSTWIHHMSRSGYVAYEEPDLISEIDAIYFSHDGNHWSTMWTLPSSGMPHLYDDKILVVKDGDVLAADAPARADVMQPLILHPGGTNLAGTTWTELTPADPGSQLREVEYLGGQYVYVDSGVPISPQPIVPPPVNSNSTIWELTSGGNGRFVGTWEADGQAFDPNSEHWLTTWQYPLENSGIIPSIQIGGPNPYSEQATRWVANNRWVPTWVHQIPDGDRTSPSITFRAGIAPESPGRWLTAVEGITPGNVPTYPLPPGGSGPNELASLENLGLTNEWTATLMFSPADISAFSSLHSTSGFNASYPIATLSETEADYILVSARLDPSADGTLIFYVDVYASGVLLDRMSFPSISLNELDDGRIVISSTPNELGATLMFPRFGSGIRSKSLVGTESIVPTRILLSTDIGGTSVTPLEWFAVRVDPDTALTTSEREAFIVTEQMYRIYATSPSLLNADFDGNLMIDGQDFLVWQRNYGANFAADKQDGDADGDADVDEVDAQIWQTSFGTDVTDPLAADYDSNLKINGPDFLIWQRNFGTPSGAAQADGDSDHDGDVDADDLVHWKIWFDYGANATAAAANSNSAPNSKVVSNLAAVPANQVTAVDTDEPLAIQNELTATTPPEVATSQVKASIHDYALSAATVDDAPFSRDAALADNIASSLSSSPLLRFTRSIPTRVYDIVFGRHLRDYEAEAILLRETLLPFKPAQPSRQSGGKTASRDEKSEADCVHANRQSECGAAAPGPLAANRLGRRVRALL